MDTIVTALELASAATAGTQNKRQKKSEERYLVVYSAGIAFLYVLVMYNLNELVAKGSLLC